MLSFAVWSLLLGQIYCADVLIIFDSVAQDSVITYLTQGLQKTSEKKLNVTKFQLAEGSLQATYTTSVCNKLTETQADIIVSVAKDSNLKLAVKEVANQARVPTVLVDHAAWLLDSSLIATSGTGYHVSFATPTVYVLSMLKDLMKTAQITNPTTELIILYDSLFNFSQDAVLADMLIRSGLPITPIVMSTDAVGQFLSLKNTQATTVLLLSSMQSVEAYFNQDVLPLICATCTRVDAAWTRPSLNNLAYGRIQEFKAWIAKEDLKKFSAVNELDASFYLDLSDLIWNTWKYYNTTASTMTYTCSGSVVTPGVGTLAERFAQQNLTGSYGAFNMFGNITFYQNTVMKTARVMLSSDTRSIRQVANWTQSKGMTTAMNLFANISSLTDYRVVLLEQPPFVQYMANSSYQGYCIDLIQAICSKLNFTCSLFEVQDKEYGTMGDDTQWTGLVRALLDGDADIALGPMSVMAERENFVDFTVPYYDLVGTTILMKKPEVDYSLFKFMTVLEGPVWGCIVAAYFFTSFLLWVFERFSPYSYTNNKEKYQDDPDKREFTLKECLWFCMTSLTPQGGGEAPKNISGRLVAATWWLFGFIIIASYTANLAAFLTVSRLDTPIQSLDDLAQQYKIKYAPVKGTASETYFKRMSEIETRFYEIWKAMSLNESMTSQERAQLAVWDYPVSDKYSNMWRFMQDAILPDTVEKAVARVLESPSVTEGFAFIGDATQIRYAALTNCKVMQVGSEFSRKPYAIAVQQNSPLKNDISAQILQLLNNRQLEQWKDKWWNENPNKVECPTMEDDTNGISIKNIGGVFIVILIGIGLSVITLLFEYCYYKDRTRQIHTATKDTVHVASAQDTITRENNKNAEGMSGRF